MLVLAFSLCDDNMVHGSAVEEIGEGHPVMDTFCAKTLRTVRQPQDKDRTCSVCVRCAFDLAKKSGTKEKPLDKSLLN